MSDTSVVHCRRLALSKSDYWIVSYIVREMRFTFRPVHSMKTCVQLTLRVNRGKRPSSAPFFTGFNQVLSPGTRHTGGQHAN